MDFTAPHFEAPSRLWFLALVLLGLGLLYAIAGVARREQLAAFAKTELLQRLLASHSPLRRVIKYALIILGVIFVGIAFARPQWGEQQDTRESSGEDTIFVLDTSKSMLAADVMPNRLERAKLAIEDYLRRHGNGRVGLVVFAGQAFLQCPLTLDYDAFTDTLRSIGVDAIPVPGSDIARALDEASRALETNEGRKLVVLLTDGEDLAGSGVRRAEELAKKKVVIYTVGLGTEAGSIIQTLSENGGLPRPMLDASGHTVVSRLDEKILHQIADATGGEYQHLGSIGDGMDRVRRAVVADENRQRDRIVRTRGIDRYQFPLGIALLLLLVEPLLRTRLRTPSTAEPV